MRTNVRRIPRLLRNPRWALALIVLLAAVLRLAAIDRLPPGLYHDEAYNGLDALNVLRGETSLFFEANNGREPLFIYLTALSVGLLGPTPGALRVVAALLGILTIPATYLLGRTLFGARPGLVAAFLAATTVWTVNLSRVALRAVAAPPLAAVALALLWQGLAGRRRARMAWAGLACGLLFYTYLAARFTPVALGLFLVYLAIWHRERLWVRGLLIFGLVAALVAAPLGAYLVLHGEAFGRAGQVSVFNPAIGGADPWRTLAAQVLKTAGGFFWRGDFIPRHNVPLRPVFDPLTAAALLGGITVAGARWRRSAAHALVLIWVAVMLLPTVLAEDAPHLLRASGVLPVLFLLPALGLGAAYDWLQARRPGALAAVGVGAIMACGAAQGGWAYARHLHSPAAYYNFEAGATALAADVNAFVGVGWQGSGLGVPKPAAPATDQSAPPARAYVAPRLWRDWASLRYLCAPAEQAGLVSADLAWPGLAEAGEVALFLWPFEDNGAAYGLLPRDRLIIAEEGALERGDLEAEPRLLYVSLRSAPLSAVPSERAVAARWEQGIDLLGYRTARRSDGSLVVDLYWHAGQELPRDYTVFVHLWEDGILVAQHDGPAAGGTYGTDRWRPGDVVLDRHVLAPSEALGDGAYQVRVGLYWWETMEHLSLLDAAGTVTQDTAYTLSE